MYAVREASAAGTPNGAAGPVIPAPPPPGPLRLLNRESLPEGPLPSPSSLIPLPRALFHLRNIIKATATKAIPATPPTIPPITDVVVGSRPPESAGELVEVLVGAAPPVDPAPDPPARVPSPLPAAEKPAASVVEGPGEEVLDVENRKEELLFR